MAGELERSLSCGECLVVFGDIVKLYPSGLCPRCGADYRDVMQKVRELECVVPEDECKVPGCARQGVRGNENIVLVDGVKVTMCDDCHAEHLMKREGSADRRAGCGTPGYQYYPEGKWGHE